MESLRRASAGGHDCAKHPRHLQSSAPLARSPFGAMMDSKRFRRGRPCSRNHAAPLLNMAVQMLGKRLGTAGKEGCLVPLIAC
jgi:hypothetical protein